MKLLLLWLAAADPMPTARAVDSCADLDNKVFPSALSA